MAGAFAPAMHLSRRFQCVLNEDATPFGRIVHQNVGHRPNQFSILYDRTTTHH